MGVVSAELQGAQFGGQEGADKRRRVKPTTRAYADRRTLGHASATTCRAHCAANAHGHTAAASAHSCTSGAAQTHARRTRRLAPHTASGTPPQMHTHATRTGIPTHR